MELALYQARNSNLSSSVQGNLGIIKDISLKPKPLIFANERLKYNITQAENNPFKFTYFVDIEVQLKEGSMFLVGDEDIKCYEILKLHGVADNQDLFD